MKEFSAVEISCNMQPCSGSKHPNLTDFPVVLDILKMSDYTCVSLEKQNKDGTNNPQ